MPTLKETIDTTVGLRLGEVIDHVWRAMHSPQSTNRPIEWGTYDQCTGLLVITNQRVIFLEEDGFLSKRHRILWSIPHEDILGCEIKEKWFPRLVLDITFKNTSMKIDLGSFFEVDSTTLKNGVGATPEEVQRVIDRIAPGIPRHNEVHVSRNLRPVSLVGGVIILFALLLLLAAWGWQESIRSQLDNLGYPDDYMQYDVSEITDLLDSGTTAGRLWNLGVIIAVFGAAVVAFAQVRK